MYLSNAFDTIDHEIQIARMRDSSISEQAVWFKHYRRNRTQSSIYALNMIICVLKL